MTTGVVRKAIVAFAVIWTIGLQPSTVAGQQFGYYSASIADYDLHGDVQKLIELPSESYNTVTGKFMPTRGEPTAIIERFSQDGTLTSVEVTEYLRSEVLPPGLVFKRDYSGNRILRSETESGPQGLIGRIEYGTKQEGDWLVLSPISVNIDLPEQSQLFAYKYRIKDDAERVVQVLGNKDALLYEIHYSQNGDKRLVRVPYFPIGEDRYVEETISYDGAGHILMDTIPGLKQTVNSYDPSGLLVSSEVRWDTQTAPQCYTYRYKLDPSGNWIRRVTYLETESGLQPQTSNRREITYYSSNR